jgi:hypothetical protein
VIPVQQATGQCPQPDRARDARRCRRVLAYDRRPQSHPTFHLGSYRVHPFAAFRYSPTQKHFPNNFKSRKASRGRHLQMTIIGEHSPTLIDISTRPPDEVGLPRSQWGCPSILQVTFSETPPGCREEEANTIRSQPSIELHHWLRERFDRGPHWYQHLPATFH